MLRWQYGAEQAAPWSFAKFPGPNHIKAFEQAEAIDNEKTHSRYINMKESKANYFIDIDGNCVLDLNQT